MSGPRSIDFIAPRAAWLLGHAVSPRRQLAAAALLLLSALLLTGSAAWWGWQRSRLTTPSPATLTVLPAIAPSAAAPALSAADRVRINRVVRRLNTPWATIFEALESRATPDVAVLALESDAERGAVRVQTEGRSLDALLLHAEQVQATTPFVRTKLLRIEPPDAAGALADATRLSFDLVIEP